MNKNIEIMIVATLLLLSALAVAFVVPSNTNTTIGTHGQKYTPDPGYVGDVYIYPNGTVSAPSAISLVSGQYVVQQDISGSIYDQRNNTALSGNGLTLNVVGTQGIVLSNIAGVTISNFHIIGSGTGVVISNGSRITVSGSTLSSSSSGVATSFSSNVTISNNAYYGPASSVFLSIMYSHYAKVSNNSGYFTGSFTQALTAAYCTHMYIDYNDFYAPASGISISYSSGIESQHNLINNTGASSTALIIAYSNHFTSSHDTIINTGSASVSLDGVNEASLQYDNFNNSSLGSSFVYSNNITIMHSDFSNLSASGSNQFTMTNNLNISYSKFLESASVVYPLSISMSTGTIGLYEDNITAPLGAGVNLAEVQSCRLVDTHIEADFDVQLSASSNGFYAAGNTLLVGSGGMAFSVTDSMITNLTLWNNNILGSSSGAVSGILLSSPVVQNVEISGNVIRNVTTGISMSNPMGEEINVYDNQIYNVSTGISAGFAYDSEITGNSIINVSQLGITVGGGNNLTITGNSVVNLTHTSGSTSYGIDLTGVILSNTTVSGNLITATNNTSTYGILLVNGANVVVSGNSISGAQFGIYFTRTTFSTIYENSVNGSEYGIDLQFNQNFSIYNNWVANTNYSLYSIMNTAGTVYGNTFISALNATFYSVADSYLTFYHNNFMNGNLVNMLISGATSLRWNLSSPIGGNYWSNYTGIAGSNGFGSTPYVINSVSKDYLPLTSRWLIPTVTFTETGLPAGTTWTVNFLGTVKTSSTNTIQFYVNTAQYHNETYEIGSVPGYVAGQGSGTVYLNGVNKTVNLQFTQKTYSVTFTESGLPASTTWSINLNGSTQTSTTDSTTFSKPNGTYSYTVGSVLGYHATSTGKVTVSGSSASVSVVFSVTKYNLTVAETGLPAGTPWSIKISNETYTTNGTSIVVSLVSGTYNVSVTALSGYTMSMQSNNATLNYAPATLNVTFAKKPSNAIYVGLGVGVAIGVLVALLATYLYTGTVPFTGRKPKSPKT